MLCGATEGLEEHHIVPKFLANFAKLRYKPDYKIVLCKQHHHEVTTAFEEIRHRMKLLIKRAETSQEIRMDDLDDAIEREYGISTLNAIWEFVSERDTKVMPEWLMRKIKQGVGEGRRHTFRYVIMINLWTRGFKAEEIAILVCQFNEKCRPPENLHTVKYHVRNTLRKWEREKGVRQDS